MLDTVDRPRLLEPGLRLLPVGTERYLVRGGGATVVSIGKGDALEIFDSEGRQPAEVTVFDNSGTNDYGGFDFHLFARIKGVGDKSFSIVTDPFLLPYGR